MASIESLQTLSCRGGSVNRRLAIKETVTRLAGMAMGGASAELFLSQRAMGQDALAVRPARAVANAYRAVATVHPVATQAALNAFDRGGNAIDAAVAAAFMLGVVDGNNSGIGGGCLILCRTAAGELVAIDGRETAPALAHRDMFKINGRLDTTASQVGALASAVPGQVDALSMLSSKHGNIGWTAGLLDAAKVAAEGVAVSHSLAASIHQRANGLRRFAPATQLLFSADGSPISFGDTLRQPDLARTLTAIATEGKDWFYRGPFSAACDRWMRENGGMMRADDLTKYVAISRQPLVTSYRKWKVIGFPPPSSGGIHIAQMLMMLERYDVKSILENEPAVGVHLLAEVMKRAFADRAHWLGDSDFADVPAGLIDRQYCKELAADIDLSRATPVTSHGKPPRAGVDLFTRQHTTHLTTADKAGNWVAITNTVNTDFGSCVVIPETGVFLNNQMDDFSISPGTPNAFGLIGAEANSIAPGKRPLSSMSPTIVLNENDVPRLTCGAAGGPRIINAVLQCIVGVLDLGLSMEEAIAAPRIHHQWNPDQLVMEPAWNPSVIDSVTGRGHCLSIPFRIAIAQGIEQTEPGKFASASDPRIGLDAVEYLKP
jgi:gamma-glutamyltranspeptidase/glutathione hydrolase